MERGKYYIFFSKTILFFFFESIDGIEYRFLEVLTRHWQLKAVEPISRPAEWDATLRYLREDKTDIAMCSIWLTSQRYTEFDLTNFYDYQCGTFLVPKPARLAIASNIYRPLSGLVWIMVIVSFVIPILFLKIASILGLRNGRDTIYSEVSRTYLDLLAIFTAHGVEYFPRQTSIKIVLIR